MLSAGGQGDVELHTGNMQRMRSGDLTIELLRLTPYPFSSRTIQPGEYRVTLRVTRRRWSDLDERAQYGTIAITTIR